MNARTLKKAVEQAERLRMPNRRKVNVVWCCGKPWGELPAELDPDAEYIHYFLGDRPSAAEWERLWESIPEKSRQ